MSNQDLHMDIETTYQCPHCHANILSSNQFTHDAMCARRQAAGNQRPAQPQMIQRENSSSGLPDTIDYSNRRPQIREERGLARNKLITCPNCEKSVREQDFANHADNECEGNDKIPCEFCDQLIPMSSYTMHVEDAHRREQEEEQSQRQQRQQEQHRSNQRPASPGRGMASRQNQSAQENRNQASRSQEQRDRSPGRNASQESTGGGFMGFLRNLVQNAAQNRSEDERPESQHQSQSQPQSHSHQHEQPQSSTRSLFSRLLGNHDHPESDSRRPMTMEDFFLRSIQARHEAERENAQRSQNPFGNSAPRGGNRTVRTINLGPHGTIVLSTGRSAMEEPEDYWQTVGLPQRRPNQMNMSPMEEMGPMGLLLSMLSSGGQGMMQIDPEQLNQLQETGLSKEDIDSLSIVKYDAEKNKNLSEDMKSCPICLEEFEDGVEVRFLWCLHRFHRKCVDQWLESHTNCPICKKDFSEMDQHAESS